MPDNPIKILLIADNPDEARLVREMLVDAQATTTGFDFELFRAEQLEQGLNNLTQSQYDLILADLSLPDSQGLDTVQRIVQAAPELPVIVMSGLEDETMAMKAVQAGAQDYLVKGYVDNGSLVRAIRYARERKRSAEEIHRRNQELSLFNQIIAASASGLEPEAILERACYELAHAFGLPQVTATLLNQEKTKATIIAEFRAPGHSSSVGRHIPVPNNPSIQYLLKHRGPLVIQDAPNDSRLAGMQELLQASGVVSLLILPLKINEDVIGSLSLESPRPRAFSADEVSLAWSVADQVAGAIARVRLNKERRLLSLAIEQTVESIVITDVAGTILYVNPAFERITGYSRDEVVGKSPGVLKSGKQDEAFYQELWDTISAGKMWQGRFINRKKDGSLFTDEATITPVKDKNGTIINYISVQRDITDELRREEQLRQSQKMEAIGRLAGGVAHDFNNLLTVITGYAELLLHRHSSKDDPSYNDIEQIRKAGERATALTRQLLTFSRKQVLQPVVLNLNHIVADIDRMLQRLIGEDIELVTRLAENLDWVKADPGQMEQIIVNLAVNARDAMPKGGKLTIETDNVELDEEYTRHHVGVEPGPYVLLAVSDAGVGMDAETQANIFEPFFTTKGEDRGTGLGLATVYGIVKQSGGHIWVYSEAEQGTTFKIYLPRVEKTTELNNSDQTLGKGQKGAETILLVEDEPMVRELARRVLQTNNYIVLEAHSGTEAIEISQKQPRQPIHLLLTDVIMPGEMSGRQLADHLTPLHPEMAVLFMSGYTDTAIVHHGVLEADTAFLQKPFTPDGLLRKVREVLESNVPKK